MCLALRERLFYPTQSPQLFHVVDIANPILKVRKWRPRKLRYLASLHSKKIEELGLKYGPELNIHALSHYMTLFS